MALTLESLEWHSIVVTSEQIVLLFRSEATTQCTGLQGI